MEKEEEEKKRFVYFSSIFRLKIEYSRTSSIRVQVRIKKCTYLVCVEERKISNWFLKVRTKYTQDFGGYFN